MADDRQQADPVETPGLETPESTETEPTEKALARGRAAGTPFVLLGSVAATIWIVLALVASAALVVWWLA